MPSSINSSQPLSATPKKRASYAPSAPSFADTFGLRRALAPFLALAIFGCESKETPAPKEKDEGSDEQQSPAEKKLAPAPMKESAAQPPSPQEIRERLEGMLELLEEYPHAADLSGQVKWAEMRRSPMRQAYAEVFLAIQQEYCAENDVGTGELPKTIRLLQIEESVVPIFEAPCDLEVGKVGKAAGALFDPERIAIAIEADQNDALLEHELRHAANHFAYFQQLEAAGIGRDARIPAGLIFAGQKEIMELLGLSESERVSPRNLDELAAWARELSEICPTCESDFSPAAGTPYHLAHSAQQALTFGPLSPMEEKALESCRKNSEECAIIAQAEEAYSQTVKASERAELLRFMEMAALVGLENLAQLAQEGELKRYSQSKKTAGKASALPGKP